jgi:gamma-glutamylcyclotransferase (GGCT)/AIG2-like uncharacterized protein YtfP
MMLKNDLLLVYGTLRQGERADLRRESHHFDVTFIGLDEINGRMYHIGTYPGVKDVSVKFNPNAPKIVGEVFSIRNPSITALLDAYEGYDSESPQSGLYNRTQVYTKKGRLVWVYTYNPIVRQEQLIESGDWCRNRQPLISGRSLSQL